MVGLYTFILLLLVVFGNAEFDRTEIESSEPHNLMRLEHPNNHELFNELKQCDADINYCDENFLRITQLCVKIANEHTALLLVDRAKRIFEDILYFSQPHSKLGQKAIHILSVLSFGQGNTQEVYHEAFLFQFCVAKIYIIHIYRQRIIGNYSTQRI